MRTRGLHPLFGAEVLGVDLALGGNEGSAPISDLATRFGVLLFRDVAFDDEALVRFAQNFGVLQNVSRNAPVVSHVIRVSNLDAQGGIKAASESSRQMHDANRLWHTDSSFMLPGCRFSLLHGRVVVDLGGETEFCDTRVAWEALDVGQRAQLRPLTASHRMAHSWALAGADQLAAAPGPEPVTRRLVRRHPSGRDALIIPSHVEAVNGFDYANGQALVERLRAIASAPDRVYRHKWRAGDLLMWDNRCMLHRVAPYDGDRHPRDLRSCRVIDCQDECLSPA